MSVPTDQNTSQVEVDAPAIRLDLDNAFSAGDDSDLEEFDFKKATADFRARLAEEEAARQHDDEHLEHEQDDIGNAKWIPQTVIRRSAEVETEISGPQISPFVATPLEEIVSPPASVTSTRPVIVVNDEGHVDQARDSASPVHENGVASDDEDGVELPTQTFEDVSLEEERPPTPLTAPSFGSVTPNVPSRPNSSAENRNPNRASWPPPEARTVNSLSFQENFKPSKRTGSSALQKVLSKTRPMHLPPKSREEDTKHLRVWEDMMKKSRQAGEYYYIAMSYF